MKKIYSCTILTISNVKSVLEKFKANLKTQKNIEVQLIVINNYNYDYLGARQAFNAHLMEIVNDYIIFMHPDIVFLNENSLYSILEYANSIEDFGVIGIAGCPPGKKWRILSSMLHGENKIQCGLSINRPIEIQTVDECLFIMKHSTVEQYRFTDIPGWHFYAVEQCIRMKNNGLKNYVIPCQVHHLSAGNSLDPSYIKILLKIINIYSSMPHYLNTTVKQWKCRSIKGRIYIYFYYFKLKIKKLLSKGK